mgnify:CR=1 FL=1
MLAELAGGLISGSLALIADAGHMLTDFAGLTLAWLGFRVARRPADPKRSYGYGRFGVLVAYTNGLALFAIAIWIVVEAWHRLQAPGEILGGVMLAVAITGLLVNLFAFWLLHGGDGNNLNVRAARLHVLGDLLGSLAALGAALVILATGWTPIDPILSVLVSLLILGSAYRIVRDSGHILLEGTPQNLDPQDIAQDLKNTVPGVVDVHHIHAWLITQDRPLVTLNARVSDAYPTGELTAAIKERLKISGGSKDLVLTDSDVIARISVLNRSRHLLFSPTDTAFGKDPAGIGEMPVPDATSPEYADCLANIIARIKDGLNALSEAQIARKSEVEWFKEHLPKFTGAEHVNGVLARARAAGRDVVVMLHERAKALGLTHDKATDQYVSQQKDAA